MRSDMVADGCFALIVLPFAHGWMWSNAAGETAGRWTRRSMGLDPLATTRVTCEIFTNTKRKVLCTHHSIAVNSWLSRREKTLMAWPTLTLATLDRLRCHLAWGLGFMTMRSINLRFTYLLKLLGQARILLDGNQRLCIKLGVLRSRDWQPFVQLLHRHNAQ